jgi:hypothetical protein
MPTNNFSAISVDDLACITGGAGTADWASIKQQASEYCPVTAAKYANVNPSTITRAKAQQMGTSCVQEISPLFRGVARGRINDAINQAFPAK